MGRGIVDQIATMAGLQVRALADVEGERALSGFTENGWDRDQVLLTDSVGPAPDGLAAGRAVATPAPLLRPPPHVQALAASRRVPDVGAEVVDRAIHRRRHAVRLRGQADV